VDFDSRWSSMFQGAKLYLNHLFLVAAFYSTYLTQISVPTTFINEKGYVITSHFHFLCDTTWKNKFLNFEVFSQTDVWRICHKCTCSWLFSNYKYPKPNISCLGPFHNRWTVRLWTDRTCTRRSHAESWRRVRCPKAHLLKGECHEKTIFF
jgi:hypothetical protein